MSANDLEAASRLLQEVAIAPDEMARLEPAVQTLNGQVLAAVREWLTFDDEPAAYVLAVARTKAP